MADERIGKTVRLPPELWESLHVEAKKEGRSVNYLLTQIVRAHVGKVVSRCNHGDTTVIPRWCTPPQDNARADAPPREQQPLSSSQEETTKSQNSTAEVAKLLRTLDWRGASLAKSTTPEAFAAVLVETYPTLDVPHLVRRAHAHLVNMDKPWKRLGRALLNWMDNDLNPPEWKRNRAGANNRPLRTHQQLDQARQGQIDWTEGTDPVDVSDQDPSEPFSFDDIPDPKADRSDQ